MPDIAMCRGDHCKRRDKCYRHTAKPSPFAQTFFSVPPVDIKTGKCEYYWPVKGWEPEKNEENEDAEEEV